MPDHQSLIEQKVRTILLHDWDPIGVSELDGALDEYDLYARSLSDMLLAGASEDELYRYLAWAEFEHMGLPRQGTRAPVVAQKLFRLTET
ncbi:hypothetical protein [Rhizobium rhizogenes]|uniref:Uncharacterized protein n=1 Tax=Rhizobium rhizogenes TaxID=359 RepID=A0AA92H9X2_RHIRH|nr:hypothetical protein [Rhizobium rhizogenes]PVE55365.1 hypothetical protein DC430_09210 [Rhizobium rhizogenes]PVE65713.1 hypothetical protein DC415_12280 [Agrobacterium tumefaciens]PVE75777.1 hypothetical protein DCP16_12280 [Sphingomonas sp. TPD3009]